MKEKIDEAVAFLHSKTQIKPITGIILGTGLGALAREIDVETDISYEDIPHFPLSTVESHSGKLTFGHLEGKPVVVMQGRFHYYEGYSMQQLTFPVRVMKLLGIEKLLISNASGGLNPGYAISDLMIISDHINLLPENPLTGKNDPELGVRFPDMSDAYSPKLIAQAEAFAEKEGIKLQKGVYVAVSGPNLETPAEYKYLRIIGGDAVGMSTVPENIVARHMGLECFAISVITDLGVEGKIKKVSLQDVVDAANKAEPLMTKIFKHLV
ncbi:MAG: purine-nucleoside phosphorylase [Cyclobacteriaceae bacterium]|nr:purine-nucleoside phosphorylase [Cyclobacteriaceae bacterium]MCH8517931.1 purine-nucleoside phosphorylase [Cyclobacteriaceae bacterium]